MSLCNEAMCIVQCASEVGFGILPRVTTNQMLLKRFSEHTKAFTTTTTLEANQQ